MISRIFIEEDYMKIYFLNVISVVMCFLILLVATYEHDIQMCILEIFLLIINLPFAIKYFRN